MMQRDREASPLHSPVSGSSSSPPPSLPIQQNRKIGKSYHVVPQDDTWLGLQEPLQGDNEAHARTRQRRLSARAALASSRVERDKLMRVMEELILKEAELASAYELFDYTRQRCSQEHDEIVNRLEQYEGLLREAQRQEEQLRASGTDDVLRSPEDQERWTRTQVMVNSTLPELLARLEESIDLNSAKIRHIQEKMEEIRAQRLSVREEIAEKEENIALALSSGAS